MPQRNSEHLLGRCHLEIEGAGQLALEAGYIGVGNMPPILPKMGRDAIGAGFDRQMRCAQRIRVPAAAGIADRGDVINIHAKTKMARIPSLSHEQLSPSLRHPAFERLAIYRNSTNLSVPPGTQT